jgi:glycosyltransferase involved in cell wall biosynthesis
MLSSGAMLFPSWHKDKPWTETSCIVALEAAAAGLRIVTAPHGALPETVKRGVFVSGELSPGWLDRFAGASIDALTAPEVDGEREAIAGSVAGMTWDAVAERLEWVIAECVAKAEA